MQGNIVESFLVSWLPYPYALSVIVRPGSIYQ